MHYNGLDALCTLNNGFLPALIRDFQQTLPGGCNSCEGCRNGSRGRYKPAKTGDTDNDRRYPLFYCK